MIAPLNDTLRKLPTWIIYVGVALYIVWEFYLAATQSGRYVVEPINELEREYGKAALIALVSGLALTPVRNFTGLNLIKFRRAIGLASFFLVMAHFLVWMLLDLQAVAQIWTQIVKHPYVTVGFLALLMMVPLAITSNDRSIRKLGALRWRRLHKLNYLIVVLGGLHYLWLVKGFQIEPILYLVMIGGLLGLRLVWAQRRAKAR